MAEEKLREDAEFLHHACVGGLIVAVFEDEFCEFCLSKKNCEERLENLRHGRRPHDQTFQALKNWPEEISH
jgi:hypothetical protein